MKQPLSAAHKLQFEEIKKSLSAIGGKETTFVKVELLFFDAMSVARTYGDDVTENALLSALKELQANQYRETKLLYNKSVQREKAIRRFVSGLKSILTAGIRNEFSEPQFH